MVLGESASTSGRCSPAPGILGVALGFGSQTLVRDFLSGLFILVEDQFGVGDIVDLDGPTAGVVEAVSLRTTRLRAVDGTVWHVPNGEIRRVGNKSQQWSRALLDVGVAYATDVEHAGAVVKRSPTRSGTRTPRSSRSPSCGASRASAPTGSCSGSSSRPRPSDQWTVSRELRQRIKGAFDREGIEIPAHASTPGAAG